MKEFGKKIGIVLLILFLLSVLISISPILPYFQSLGAELDTATASLITTSAAETTDALVENTPNSTAITFGIVLSAATIVIALLIYLKKHDPNR